MIAPRRLMMLGMAIALAGVSGFQTAPATASAGPGSLLKSRAPVLLAAGDIACDPTSPYFHSHGLCQQDRVGKRVRIMIRRGADWFVPLGDNQYETGSLSAYDRVYDRAFGSVLSKTRPVPGNHEYERGQARGYFRYFGKRAGTPHRSWRTFVPAPGWRVLQLNSNCEFIDGCGKRSPEGRWIKAKLAAATEPCIIAAWHHPLQTSGEYFGNHDSRRRARKLWNLVAAGGADIVLNGHDHIYERFAKRDGMQQFLVGTGGKNHYRITTKAPGSRKRIDNHYGVLKLTMKPDGSYDHAFVTAGGQVLDSGHGRCTNSPEN